VTRLVFRLVVLPPGMVSRLGLVGYIFYWLCACSVSDRPRADRIFALDTPIRSGHKYSADEDRELTSEVEQLFSVLTQLVHEPSSTVGLPADLYGLIEKDLARFSIPSASVSIFDLQSVRSAVSKLPDPERKKAEDTVARLVEEWTVAGEKSRVGIALEYQGKRSLPLCLRERHRQLASAIPYFHEPTDTGNDIIEEVAQMGLTRQVPTSIRGLAAHPYSLKSRFLPVELRQWVGIEFLRLRRQLNIHETVRLELGSALVPWAGEGSVRKPEDCAQEMDEQLINNSRDPQHDPGYRVLWLYGCRAQNVIHVSPRLVMACFLYAWQEANAGDLEWYPFRPLTTQLLGNDAKDVFRRKCNKVRGLFQRNIGFLLAHELAHFRVGVAVPVNQIEFDCDMLALTACASAYGTAHVGVFSVLLALAVPEEHVEKFWGLEVPITEQSKAELDERWKHIQMQLGNMPARSTPRAK